MKQLIPQSETIIPNSYNPLEIVGALNDYIERYSCENMSVDISFMNIPDACYVSSLCSTTNYIKYPDGKINWKVSSQQVKEFTDSLNLGNSNYEI